MIFQQLLDLKQMQFRIGQANEQVFAKRLIDGFRKDAVTVGLRPYDGSYSFQQLEVYLYSKFLIYFQFMSGSDLTMKSRNRSVEAGTRWADLVATSGFGNGP
jgi:hypothetical protein